ncbi:MAG TPA: anti-sigma factor [Acidimicrobiia bacterium]|jgi:anti-sigma-K factor RskA
MTADIHSLAGAYVLNALDEQEAVLFEEHIAACSVCAQEVRELRATAGRLGAAVGEPAPTELRGKVMGQIDRTRQAVPSEPGRSRPPSRWRRLSLPVAAALAGLALVLGFGLGRLAGSGPADPNAAALAAVIAAPDTVLIELAGPPEVRASFVYSDEVGSGVLVAEGLEAAPAGRTYELWLITADGPAPAGLFPGGELTTIQADGDVTIANAVGITLEPEGGSPAPTGEILVSGEL